MTFIIASKAYTIKQGVSGNTDYLHPEALQGATPDGVIAISIGRQELENPEARGWSIGAYDGTNQWQVGHGGAEGNQRQNSNDGRLLHPGEMTADAVWHSGTGAALIENGVRINWTTDPSGGVSDDIMVIIFFAGTDMEFATGMARYDATSLTTGFSAEAAMFFGMNCILDSVRSGRDKNRETIGMAIDGVSVTQFCKASSEDTAAPTPAAMARAIFNDCVVAQIDNDASPPVRDEEVSVTSFDATTITVAGGSAGADAGAEVYGWVALGSGDTMSWDLTVQALDQSVSTTIAKTGVGFKPQGIFAINSDHKVAAGTDTGATYEEISEGVGFCHTNGGDGGGLQSLGRTDDGASSSATGKNTIHRRFLDIYGLDTSGADSQQATYEIESFDSDGFTLEVIANVGSGDDIQIPMLAYGAAAGAADTTTDTQIAMGSAAANTSLGTQDITASLGGVTPKGCIIQWARTTMDGSPEAEGAFGCGFIGTDGWARTVARRWKDNVAYATPPGLTHQDYNVCVDMLTPSTNTSEGVAIFDSFITNGVRIEWTTAPPSGWRLEVIFFAGASVQCAARQLHVDDNRHVDNCGFGFDAGAAILCSNAQVDDTYENDDELNFGVSFITNEATPEISVASVGITSSGDPRYRVDDEASANVDGFVLQDGSGADAEFDVTFLGLGLRAEAQAGTGNPSNESMITVFGMKIPSGNFDSRIVSLTAGSGSESVTGFGFAPTHMISYVGRWQTQSTGYAAGGQKGENFGFGYFNGLTRQRCLGMAHANGSGASDSVSYWKDDRWAYAPDHDGSDAVDIEVTSVDSDGFTVQKYTLDNDVLIPTLSFGAAIVTTAGVAKGNWL